MRLLTFLVVLGSLFAKAAPRFPRSLLSALGPHPQRFPRCALRAALGLMAPLGPDGRIVRIGLLRGNEMLPGSFEALLTAQFPRSAPFGASASSRPGALRARRVRMHFFSTLLVLVLAAAAPLQAETVIFLVRHAEKVDESADPDLTDAGRERARAIAGLLKDAGIEAVLSTDFLRTRETARPMAELVEKPVEIYDDVDPEAFAQELRRRDDRTLVVGHSNTVPGLVRALGGEPGPEIGPDEYDRLYVVHLGAAGHACTSLLRLP